MTPRNSQKSNTKNVIFIAVCPGLGCWGDGDAPSEIVYIEENMFRTGLTEQQGQDKNLLNWHDEANEQIKDGPLSFVLHKSSFVCFNRQQGPTISGWPLRISSRIRIQKIAWVLFRIPIQSSIQGASRQSTNK